MPVGSGTIPLQVLCIHWRSWEVFLADKVGLLYLVFVLDEAEVKTIVIKKHTLVLRMGEKTPSVVGSRG